MLSGVQLKNFATAIVLALVLALLNATVKPILVVLTLPLTLLTLGIFLVVIAGLVLKIADWLIDGLKIRNFGWAMALALIAGLLNAVLLMLLP